MPRDTRVYLQVGALVPSLGDFVVQTTHGNIQEAIQLVRQRGDGGTMSLVDSVHRYDRGQLVEWATTDSPPRAWDDWCTDVLLLAALKHCTDGKPVALVRPERAAGASPATP